MAAQEITLSRILRELREKHDMSQYRLAKLINVDHSYISRLESGQRRPSYDILLAIASALGLETEERKILFASAGYLLPEEIEAILRKR
ncbi:helix-turn-helix transcriptional regulator [Thermomicrobium sp. 4228-Ro]|uniref:helix-turn-helix domain-containing protein n=1 Tax=Thermomicrobium sp. 4228-Ro TaxID=2993937 RepID=UPI0022497154|nr:helix-turn-helix transcriptional regulator [Thermomicrobium sp. 4228-Ro]MCX2725983.1 helix-turn-helix transcriptional regulator [Thermomicrobium sp. 4228-Ro]